MIERHLWRVFTNETCTWNWTIGVKGIFQPCAEKMLIHVGINKSETNGSAPNTFTSGPSMQVCIFDMSIISWDICESKKKWWVVGFSSSFQGAIKAQVGGDSFYKVSVLDKVHHNWQKYKLHKNAFLQPLFDIQPQPKLVFFFLH